MLNISKCILNNAIKRSTIRLIISRNQSTKASVEKQPDEKSAIRETFEYEKLNISTKIHKKSPQKPPLAKNLFVAKVDTDLLAYPEVITKDDLKKLEGEIEPNKRYFQESLDTKNIEATRLIPKTVLEDLKNLRIFGNDIPQSIGGRGYLVTETSLSSEAEGSDVNIASLIASHRMTTQIILELGTEEQQLKYLSKLAKGDLIGTVAIFESQSSDTGAFNTNAVQIDDNTWSLSGEKSFIVNGPDASLFVVLARTTYLDNLGDNKEGVTVFLVEGTETGVTKSSPDLTIGCRGVKQGSIKFDNTPISFRNVLGEVGGGADIGQKLLKIGRLQSGVFSALMMKQILGDLTNFGTHTKQAGINLSDMDLIKNRLAKSVCDTYAIESMTYLTTGLIDGYENQDVDLEAAMLKAFALDKLWETATKSMHFKGPTTLISRENSEKYFRDSAQLVTQGESLDSIKMFIGLVGLQHSGLDIHETVKKVRNPLMNPGFIFGRVFERRNYENPKLTLKINHSLHPSLDPAAQWLELSILRLQLGTEQLLSRHGPEIIQKQVEVMRLAECGILVYAMFCAVSRASRAYCIGLRHADYEMLIASAFCLDGCEKVKNLIKEIAEGPFLTNDHNYEKIGKQLFKSKGYFLEHPLTRNF